MKSFERPQTGERAVLVRLGLGMPVDPEDLEEFRQLATSAGAIPGATVTGRRERPDPRFFLGSGKAEELRDVCEANAADVVLVDHALSPSQGTASVMMTLTKGKVATRLVTILPGRRIDQVRADLINSGFSPSSVDAALQPSQYADLPVMACNAHAGSAAR